MTKPDRMKCRTHPVAWLVFGVLLFLRRRLRVPIPFGLANWVVDKRLQWTAPGVRGWHSDKQLVRDLWLENKLLEMAARVIESDEITCGKVELIDLP